MSIDEAIEKFKLIANSDAPCPRYCMLPCDKCVDESKQLAEWLEELKAIKENSISKEAFEKMKSRAYKKGHRQGYNKALYDFVKFANTMPTVETEDGEIRPMRLKEMAEKLKE